ncbi:PQQ enzyme repeat domain protein OS=Halorubrum saccharovorum DSM 1137 GN=C471_00065 PE=4 SV=1: PQQ_3: PQQ_2 [Gemmataceae bacterium]|nr:PQQ enzyme repeat domain protein OS=Halorubrum saccharovorum DSM 1137 GN=C471_00065 PE=4 SV=1: PQQ_3: PQQ_2 [Gemmataceae bacterium]VTU00613.1 PQQ enzyme repeat domain protein OS=Halorubrum saccharovorum DSM 1137 GN=C471_00065 PE=4 SV=1: PQQ_3: PQQ_2 [Gemmataceae bacterium]
MSLRSLLVSLCVLRVLCGESTAAEPGPWGTYRGTPQRTGNTDNKAGPEKPVVLWAVRSNDHFLAAPVPVKDSVFVAGVGAFNRPTVTLFPLTEQPPTKATWAKSAPYLKLASVSSPAVAGEYLVFGDGMHQDSGGVLHCVSAATSKPVWQLTLPGDLIHLEGGPLVAGNRAYIGGGAAGVICVETDKATLDGKEHDLATVSKMQDAKWKELSAKYEELKAKKDDFAIPPDDSQLLKFAPKKVWQKGEAKWHVDAPVNLAGDTLLVPTSYLDKEKVGERALYALSAATGETVWKRELALNPWGGATVAGDLAIVPGSSIGYYLKELKGAKGDVTAIDLKTGEVKWKKDVPGGVVGCVAVSDGLAVFTATDGKVRAFKAADGERAWLYDCKFPVFAPPAVAGGVVYAADLNGVVHAVDLKTGTPKWTLAAAKDGGAPGMVYGGVTVHGGKLIVATCNLEGPNAGKETVVVCIGTK